MLEWAPEVPSSEVPPDHPIVETALGGRRRHRKARPGDRDGLVARRRHVHPLRRDAVDLLRPRGAGAAHTIDESVAVADLVAASQALAVAALRFCGES